MSNTLWCGFGGDKLYLQSGQFSSTMKTSLDIGSVDAVPMGISWDGTNTPWCGAAASKLYLQSGQFSSTMKTSLAATAIGGVSSDGTNTPWCASSGKLYVQSGQFSATVKTSLDVSSVDNSVYGISWDGTNTPWAGSQGIKLYLQSGQFSSTMKTSFATSSIEAEPREVSWDGTNTPWCGSADDKLYLQSGQFSSTMKTSLDVQSVDNGVSGIEDSDFDARAVASAEPVELAGTASSALSCSGILNIDTLLISAVSVAAGAAGVLNIDTLLISAISGTSALDGTITFGSDLISSISSVSNCSGALDIQTLLVSSASEVSYIVCAFVLGISIAAVTNSTSNTQGVLSVQTEFQSSITATSSTASDLTVDEGNIIGSIAATSDTTGSLSIAFLNNSFVNDVNCVAQWKFEDGAITVDSKGNNTLTESGSPTANISAYKEGAASLQLDIETDDHLYITDSNLDAGFPFKNGDTNKKMSVCFWVRLDSFPQAPGTPYYCICKEASSKRCFNIRIKMNNDELTYGVSFQLSTDGVTFQEVYTHASDIGAEKWYHIGVTYQAGDGALRVRVWDDSAQAILGSDLTDSGGAIFVGNADIEIGGRSGVHYSHMDGQIDEMVVFNDVLTTNEIDRIRAGTYPTSISLQGIITETSNVAGALNITTELVSAVIEISELIALVNIQTELNGQIICVIDVIGHLNIQQDLQGQIAAGSNILGGLAFDLKGIIAATSSVADCALPFRVLGFYESLSNQISAYFQTNIAEELSIAVRYDNDPRETPVESIWMEYSIDYGSANQFEIGIKSYRHIGNINARLKVSIGKGTGRLLDVVDGVVDAFKVIEISDIIFKVPRVVNVGRVEDEYQMNVICPFFVDE